jgi:hypothetical protein
MGAAKHGNVTVTQLGHLRARAVTVTEAHGGTHSSSSTDCCYCTYLTELRRSPRLSRCLLLLHAHGGAERYIRKQPEYAVGTVLTAAAVQCAGGGSERYIRKQPEYELMLRPSGCYVQQ